MTRRLLLLFLLLGISAGACKATPARTPVVQSISGKQSTVHLIQVRRLTENDVRRDCAPDGLEFTFLIIDSETGPDGGFTFSELRDVQLDGVSYVARTDKELNKRIEPHSIMEDPSKVRIGGTTLADAYRLGSRNAVSMRTTLYGSKLPANGDLVTTIQVGWRQQVEPFEFRTRLETIP